MSAAPTGTTNPQRAREALERLGPTFVKVGQFLSLRPDLIAAEYCDEFLQLTDDVRPVPFDTLQGILEAELGDPGKHFVFFDTHPLAAGSLAQVHTARTHAGEEVAVKILRPGVDESIHADLKKAHVVARILALLGVSGGVSPQDVARELDRWLREELDLAGELRHLVRMRALCAKSEIVVVPKPYPKLSSARVLTCERLHGTPMSEVLRYLRRGQTDRVAALGYDPEILAQNLLKTMLQQVFRYQYFHADIHPGNLLALPDNRIGLLDFALTDSLDPVVRKGTARYLAAVADQDPAAMLRAVTEVLSLREDADLDAFKAEFTAATRTLLRDRARGAPALASAHVVRDYMVAVMQIARNHRYVVPPGILSLYRSLLAAETIAAQLDGGTDLLGVGERFFRRMQMESLLGFDPKMIQRIGLQLINLLQSAPGQMARLMEDLADERFVLRVRSADALERRQQHNARTQLLTLGLVAISVAVLLVGAPSAPLFGWLPLRLIFGAALVAVYIALVVQWRRLR